VIKGKIANVRCNFHYLQEAEVAVEDTVKQRFFLPAFLLVLVVSLMGTAALCSTLSVELVAPVPVHLFMKHDSCRCTGRDKCGPVMGLL
jgi:hypothetical protein